MANGDWKTVAIARAKELFNPRSPVAEKKFLAGRSNEIARLRNVIEELGAHAIIFGDRGVGKSSIANCIEDSLLAAPGVDANGLLCIRVNCASNDSYSSLWRKVFGKIIIDDEREAMGFGVGPRENGHLLSDDLGDNIAVDQVQQLLTTFGSHGTLVIILDEFERLEIDNEVKRLLADTIKALADFSVPVTIVFVGVGESISQLLKEHESLNRHLVEVPVPRLQVYESASIFADRLSELGMSIDPSVQATITYLSKGLPYYVHLLGRRSIIAAIEEGSSRVESVHMQSAFKDAVEHSKQAMKAVYYDATLTNQTRSQYRQCLAACAMAKSDLYGYFTASNVVDPMSKIMGRSCDVASFNEKLVDFCGDGRGRILQKRGKVRSWRYRFTDPLMGPFVLLNALEEKIISTDMMG